MTRAKDLTAAIQWHEGMLLAPQHFQLLAKRQESLVAYHVLASQPFAWGVRRLAFDAGLLASGTLRVIELEAIMPDGLVISHSPAEAGGEALELQLEPYAAQFQKGALRVFLAVVAPGFRSEDASGGERYRSIPGEPAQDEHAAGEPIEIPRLRPNLHLLAGDTPSSRFVSFPVASVVRENELYKLGEYVPPTFELPTEHPLWQTCDALSGKLREKAAFVAKQTTGLSSKIEDRVQLLELRERLRSLVNGLPFFEAVLQTRSVHPYALYLGLSSMIGPLSLIRPGGLPPVPPAYRHDDLRRTFEEVLALLEQMLEAVTQTHTEHKFEYLDGAFRLQLEARWIEGRLVAAMRGKSDHDLSVWLQGCLIGSDQVIVSLRERRILGAPRSIIDRADELGLVGGGGVTLFAIEPEPSFVAGGRPLVIFNPLEGASALQPTEVVLYVRG